MNKDEYLSKYLENNIELIPVTLSGCLKDGEPNKEFFFPKGWKEIYNKDFLANKEFNKKNSLSIRTGKINNLTVIDIDFKDEDRIKKILDHLHIESLESVPCVETRKGFHLFFKWNENLCEGGNTTDYATKIYGEGLDIRGEGGLVFAPPSKYNVPGHGTFEYKIFGENADIDSFLEDITGDGLITDIHSDFIHSDYKKGKTKTTTKKDKPNQKILKSINANPQNTKKTINLNLTLTESIPPQKQEGIQELTEIHKAYLDLIVPDSYEKWMRCLSVIKRLGYCEKIGNDWSKKCPDKYDKDEFIKKWNHSGIEDLNYTEGTLLFYAREVDEDKANDIKSQRYNKLVMTFIKNSTDYGMAILFNKIMKNVHCINDTKKIFLKANKFNKWEEFNKPLISNYLSVELYEIFNENWFYHYRLSKNIKDDKEQLEEIEYLKKLKKFQISLQTQKFKSNFITEIATLTYDHKIVSKLDETNLYLINFDNGAYDLKHSKFIIPEPEDYISKTCGYDYTDEIDTEIRDEIFNILNKIYKNDENNSEMRDYNLKAVASCLCGYNKFENFFVWTGCGGNGKGILDNLFKRVFGEYYDVIDASYFTQTKTNSASASPEISDKNGIRMLVSTECRKGESFQTNTLKKLSGNDDLSTRGLYQSQFKFVPQFTMFFQANGCPNLSDIDEGFKRRFRLIEYPVQFVTNPDKSNKYEEKKDCTIKEKFQTEIKYRQQMMIILIEYYNKFIKDNTSGEIETPRCVSEFTKEFIFDNNILGQFFEEVGFRVTNNKTHKIKCLDLWKYFRKSEIYSEEQINYGRNDFYKLVTNYEGIRRVKRSDALYFTGLTISGEDLAEFLNHSK